MVKRNDYHLPKASQRRVDRLRFSAANMLAALEYATQHPCPSNEATLRDRILDASADMQAIMDHQLTKRP